MEKRILVLTTGGTIASSESVNGLVPTLTSKELLSFLPESNMNCKIETIEVCNMDSTDMTYKEWLLIAKAIENNYKDYDGFVICHGTDTMAYTASALSYLIQNSSKPIVLTGAQRPIKSEITDAKTNMLDSILCACDDRARDVQLVFDGQVIAGTRAKKIKSFSYHAFSSINFPNLAVIQNDKVLRYFEAEQNDEPVKFYDKMNPKVFLLKLTPGVQPYILSEIFKQYDCVIVESFGVGGIPLSLINEFTRELEKYPINQKVVIMTTQVTYEGSNVGVYEVGHRIRERFRFLEAYDMTLEAAFTKIMWIMGMDKKEMTFEEIEELFYNQVNHDIFIP